MAVLLTLTTTEPPATDLGFLLHKHPDRVQSFEVVAGQARVFYPRAEERECTAALLVEADPVELARRRRREPPGFALGAHVNDRPYAASSLLAVAMGKVFRTALNGRCDARPELVERALPLQVHLPVVAGDPELVRRLFEPLGWEVDARPLPLEGPERGDSGYVELNLDGSEVLAEALNQLYVLLPVLDGAKHYWVDEEEVDKLLRAGGDWLAAHPERELISRRYLVHVRRLVTGALNQLADEDADEDTRCDEREQERSRPLAAARREAVLDALRTRQARRVVDFGCGDGKLLGELAADPAFTEIVGVDVAPAALDRAERSLDLSERQRERLTLRQSALTYTDSALTGYDAVVLMEVVEHLDPDRLPAMERTVFGHARPGAVLVTTPNVEYNVRYPELADGGFRHPDHRFEFDRAGFAAWAERVAANFGYEVALDGIGDVDAEVGTPTQMAVFTSGKQSEDTAA